MPNEPADEKPQNTEANNATQSNEGLDRPVVDEGSQPRDERSFDQPVQESPSFAPTPDIDVEPATLVPEPPLAVTSQQFQEPAVESLQLVKSKRSKKLLVGGIIAAVGVFLLAGSALAYNVWYQNPQKILGDAIANSMTAKSVNIDSKIRYEIKAYTPKTNDIFGGVSAPASENSVSTVTVKADANYEIAQIDVGYVGDDKDKTSEVSGSAILDYKNSDYYIKVNDIIELVEPFLGSAEQTPAAITSIIEKISGNWVKFTDEDLGSLTGQTSGDAISSCVQKVVEEVNTNDSYKNELASLYMKHPILIVSKQLGSRDGMLGYEIEPSIENTNQFIKGFNTSKFYAEIKKCDDSIKDIEPVSESTSDDEADDTTVSVWISRWSHQLKEVQTNSDTEYSSSTSTSTVNFNQPLKTSIPKNYIDLKELQSDIEKAQTSLIGSVNPGDFVFEEASASNTRTLSANIGKTAEVYYAINATYPTYDELLKGNPSSPEAMLDDSSKLVLSKNFPSATNPKFIQYEQCNAGKGAAVRYYNETTQKVETMRLGECSTA